MQTPLHVDHSAHDKENTATGRSMPAGEIRSIVAVAERIGFLHHGESDDPALLADRASELGLTPVCVRADISGVPMPDLDEVHALVVLGSIESVSDRDVSWIAPERSLVSEAVARGVPVLGICFGGQLLADVLGGRVFPSPEPEFGWRKIASTAPEVVPSGPWLLWHRDAFSGPPGATEIASSENCAQAFTIGSHLGLQFHPEATPSVVDGWAAESEACGELDAVQLDRLRTETRAHAPEAAGRARSLFDGFLQRAGVFHLSRRDAYWRA
jgi:GMP synthase (glutamine-hydrolysing)